MHVILIGYSLKLGHWAKTSLLKACLGIIALAMLLMSLGCSDFKKRQTINALPLNSPKNLPGWRKAGLFEAYNAFKLSCPFMTSKLPKSLQRNLLQDQGSIHWDQVCQLALRANVISDSSAKAFFNEFFTFWKIEDDINGGLYTGYYEADIRGSEKRTSRYKYPIYSRPTDLVSTHYLKSRYSKSKKVMWGRRKNGVIVPYYTRAEITDGAVAQNASIIAWGDSLIDIFFLQIQGSGRIQLPNGRIIRVGYAASNGHPYTSVGKILSDAGELFPEEISMQTIRAWLAKNPTKVKQILNSNARFIFFKKLKTLGPVGAMGVTLIPGRSIAVDPRIIPMGAPIWIDTSYPASNKPMQKLMVAQDVGIAIKGGARGDIFFGYGKKAAADAGLMKQRGNMFVLLPKRLRSWKYINE
ncbi:MAG: transglycosylase [Rhodospirillaceae bacterium]|nr:transglycosylase [Rhodospirillaceae bacterium]